jgi:hypothetical protein
MAAREYRPHGAKFYEYVLIYSDDILAIGKDPRREILLRGLNKYFTLKED